MSDTVTVNFKTGTKHADPPTCGVEVDDEQVVVRTRQQIDDDEAYKGLTKCKKCFD